MWGLLRNQLPQNRSYLRPAERRLIYGMITDPCSAGKEKQ